MKNLKTNSVLDQTIKGMFGVTSKTKFMRLKNMILLLHKSDGNKCTVSRMASNLNCDRRSVYRYIAHDLKDEVLVVNGFIHLRSLSMAA